MQVQTRGQRFALALTLVKRSPVLSQIEINLNDYSISVGPNASIEVHALAFDNKEID